MPQSTMFYYLCGFAEADDVPRCAGISAHCNIAPMIVGVHVLPRLTPRQKKIYIYLFELCKNVYNREDTVLSKPVSVLSPTSFSHIING